MFKTEEKELQDFESLPITLGGDSENELKKLRGGGYRQLAIAIVMQAIQDFIHGSDPEAKEWLLTEGIELMGLAGIDIKPGAIDQALSKRISWIQLKKQAFKEIKQNRSKNKYAFF